MSKEEILKGNKLIASFMDIDDSIPHDHQGMYLYHSSWDWLMPVVEKIESLGYIIKYLSTPTLSNRWYIYNMEVKKSYYDSVVKVESNYQNNESKLNTYYKGCIEFIKYYNKLNEAN